MRILATLLPCVRVACGACGACGGGDPADVEGDFTIALTNHDNGCRLANWTIGEQSSNIPVALSRDGSTATADVMAGAGVVLDLALGSHIYEGEVDGEDLFLELFGTRSQTQATARSRSARRSRRRSKAMA